MMETRTIKAKTMSDALRQTRKILGPEALILSARNLESSGMVEVTAVGTEKKKNAPLRQQVSQAQGAQAFAAAAGNKTRDMEP